MSKRIEALAFPVLHRNEDLLLPFSRFAADLGKVDTPDPDNNLSWMNPRLFTNEIFENGNLTDEQTFNSLDSMNVYLKARLLGMKANGFVTSNKLTSEERNLRVTTENHLDQISVFYREALVALIERIWTEYFADLSFAGFRRGMGYKEVILVKRLTLYEILQDEEATNINTISSQIHQEQFTAEYINRIFNILLDLIQGLPRYAEKRTNRFLDLEHLRNDMPQSIGFSQLGVALPSGIYGTNDHLRAYSEKSIQLMHILLGLVDGSIINTRARLKSVSNLVHTTRKHSKYPERVFASLGIHLTEYFRVYNGQSLWVWEVKEGEPEISIEHLLETYARKTYQRDELGINLAATIKQYSASQIQETRAVLLGIRLANIVLREGGDSLTTFRIGNGLGDLESLLKSTQYDTLVLELKRQIDAFVANKKHINQFIFLPIKPYLLDAIEHLQKIAAANNDQAVLTTLEIYSAVVELTPFKLSMLLVAIDDLGQAKTAMGGLELTILTPQVIEKLKVALEDIEGSDSIIELINTVTAKPAVPARLLVKPKRDAGNGQQTAGLTSFTSES